MDGNIEYLKRLKNNGGIINNFDKNKYKDPDGIIETVVINGLPICLSTDGFCSITKIIQFSENDDEIIKKYEIIRRGKYLKWPVYQLSINQQRGYKFFFDDRIDLLLLDLEKYYEIYEGMSGCTDKSTLLINQMKEVDEKCILSKAYSNVHTMAWLNSFKTFDDFMKDNDMKKLEPLLADAKEKGITLEGKLRFDQVYFENLVKICENWNMR